jgi:omega-hydroxy-beta-dihydromenaquinone-9 sulfotransferase
MVPSSAGFPMSYQAEGQSRRYLNMTARAWLRLRKNWHLPLTAGLWWQCLVAGGFFTAIQSLQAVLTAKRRRSTSTAGSIVVLGYWRSGTTLLHNYLALDSRFGYPTTYGCMNPHHFALTQSAVMPGMQRGSRRPMDDVRVYTHSPQEDEFALLSLGARSPYEALFAPGHLADALALGDPRDLPEEEELQWQSVFMHFLENVSVAEGGRPLVLKSPTHGYRVATLRKLMPDARYIQIVRHPEQVFESTVRMWRSLFPLYALTDIPPEADTRRAVLADRPRFEEKLAEGLDGLSPDRLAVVRYEQLVENPREAMGGIYEQLKLGNFGDIESSIARQSSIDGRYMARNACPPEKWLIQVRREWRCVYEKYGYGF